MEPQVRYYVNPEAPSPCFASAMVHHRNMLWIYGGSNAALRKSSQFFSFDLKAKRWTRHSELVDEGTPNPEAGKYVASKGTTGGARNYHSMNLWAKEDSKAALVVFGGIVRSDQSKQRSNDLYLVHLEETGPRWELITTTHGPTGRSHHASLLYKDKLYIFGGYAESANPPDLSREFSKRCLPTDELWSFDLEKREWTLASVDRQKLHMQERQGHRDSKLARAVINMIRVGCDIYVLGGNVGEEDEYENTRDFWKCRILPPKGVHRLQVIPKERDGSIEAIVSWKHELPREVEEYIVELLDGSEWTHVRGQVTRRDREFEFRIPNLKTNTKHTVRVIARNCVGGNPVSASFETSSSHKASEKPSEKPAGKPSEKKAVEKGMYFARLS
jgi:hypothetical protein